jgi:hypothetical protein
MTKIVAGYCKNLNSILQSKKIVFKAPNFDLILITLCTVLHKNFFSPQAYITDTNLQASLEPA